MRALIALALLFCSGIEAQIQVNCARQAEMPAAVGKKISSQYDLTTCWLLNLGPAEAVLTRERLSAAMVAHGVRVADTDAARLQFREVTRKGGLATFVRVAKRVGRAVEQYGAPAGAALIGSGPWVAAAWVVGDRLVRESLSGAEARIPQEQAVVELAGPDAVALAPGQSGKLRLFVVAGDLATIIRFETGGLP